MKAGTTDDHPEARALFGHPETIAEFYKPAGARCQHQQHHKGCKIYNKRPLGCRIWNCRWLLNDDTADMSRPDRAHYVIDILPDFVVLEQDGVTERVPVVQIWIDTKHPEAINDPALRNYMERRGQDGMLSLIRLDARNAITVFPPSMSPDGQWNARGDGLVGKQWSTWPERIPTGSRE